MTKAFFERVKREKVIMSEREHRAQGLDGTRHSFQRERETCHRDAQDAEQGSYAERQARDRNHLDDEDCDRFGGNYQQHHVQHHPPDGPSDRKSNTF